MTEARKLDASPVVLARLVNRAPVMVVQLETCTIAAFDLKPVVVEVDLSPQLPAFSLVGLASSMTQESRERVRAAVCNSGFEWPGRKITVNLTPTDMPKWGSAFELPMALGIMMSSMPAGAAWPEVFAFGELSLSGEIKPSGMGMNLGLWLSQRAANRKLKARIAIAHPDDIEAIAALSIPGVQLLGASSLKESLAGLLAVQGQPQTISIESRPAARSLSCQDEGGAEGLEALARVREEPLAVLAGIVALAHERHHVLLAGPHGTGKSMVAAALGKAQGQMSVEERAERILVGRAFGEAPGEITQKAVVYLQTGMSRAALEGSVMTSGQALPGELSRAHGGLVVMDEFLEFRRDALECLRQPLEEGIVRLQRAQFRAALPARFQLIATTNLCPCGHLGSLRAECRCLLSSMASYRRKLSGPLIDRFDLVALFGQRFGFGDNHRQTVWSEQARGLAHELLKPADWQARIKRAKLLRPKIEIPADMTQWLGPGLSWRGAHKVSEVARTVAALEGQKSVAQTHAILAQWLRYEVEKVFKNNGIYKLE